MPRSALLLATFVSLACVSSVCAQFPFFGKGQSEEPPIAWIGDPAEALAAARDSGRPIIAYVTSDHCGYCRKMDRETWRQPAVARFVERGFVPLRLGAETHPDEVAALRVRAFPTTVILSPEGKAIAGKAGFLAPMELADLLRPSIALNASKPSTVAMRPIR